MQPEPRIEQRVTQPYAAIAVDAQFLRTDHRDPSRWCIEIAFLLREGATRGHDASNSSP